MKDLIASAKALQVERDKYERIHDVSGHLAILTQTSKDGTVSYYYLGADINMFLPATSKGFEASRVVTCQPHVVEQAVKNLKIHEAELGVTFSVESAARFALNRMDEIDRKLIPLLDGLEKMRANIRKMQKHKCFYIKGRRYRDARVFQGVPEVRIAKGKGWKPWDGSTVLDVRGNVIVD